MSTSTKLSRMRGVTLMELMTVVGVIGILSAIAIPAYSGYVIRVNRLDAKRDLISLAQLLERCYTRGNNYTIQEQGSATACVTLPATNPEGTYTVTGAITANTFLLTATPINGQARDTKCAAFTLNQTGGNGVTGTSNPRMCWEGRE